MGFGVYMGSFLTKGGALCTSCCPTTPPPGTACQWVAQFTYSEYACVWTLSVAPHKVTGSPDALHAAGDFCDGMTITRYGEIHTDNACGESSPEGFDAAPTVTVWYVVCDHIYTGEGCDDGNIISGGGLDAPIGIDTSGAGCPATVNIGGDEMTFPFSGGECVYNATGGYSRKVSYAAGPFCSYGEADAWALANESSCPPAP